MHEISERVQHIASDICVPSIVATCGHAACGTGTLDTCFSETELSEEHSRRRVAPWNSVPSTIPKAQHASHAAAVLGLGFPFSVAHATTTNPAGNSRIDAAAGDSVSDFSRHIIRDVVVSSQPQDHVDVPSFNPLSGVQLVPGAPDRPAKIVGTEGR